MNLSEASRKFLRQGFLLDIPTKILKTLQHGSNTSYLDTLSALALDPRYTSLIFVTHEAIFVEICSRWLQKLRLDPNVDPLTAVVAIAQVLPVAPHLSVYAKELLLHQRPGILQVFASRKVTALMEIPGDSLHLLLLSMYRLLKFENKGFEAIVCPAQLQVVLSHHQHSIRYLAVRIFCLYLHASDAAMSQMINRYCCQNEIAGAWEDKIIDYVFLTLWEEKRLKELAQALIDSRNDSQTSNGHHSIPRILVSRDFSSQTALMGNVLVPRLAGKPLDQSLMVLTDTSIRNVSIFAQAINQEQPLLVTGPAGCGKTLLVDTVSRELGKSDSIVTLHLNEQTDAKLLIGMYTSADTPGSFTWRPGVLTKAVAEGRWVLIEDLDRAPTEILSTLLPLLERKELLVPHWGGNIPAAVGFKMIATIRTNNVSNEKEILPRLDMLGIRHWLRVPLLMHTDEDLARIITSRFPVLHAYVSKICKLYDDLAQPKTDDHYVVKNSFNTARGLGPQDLFKLCRRLEDLLIKAGVESGNEPISESLNDMIFLETVDCFAAQFPQGATKSHIVNLISQELHIHPSRAKFCLEDRKPDYVDNELILQIGRANILKRNPNHPNYSKQRAHKAPFAMTAPVLRVLESLAVAIRMAEPCLLIGETGTGKTTLVQQLADILGYRLTVVNLSQQSEAGDLLGGYKPLNIRAITVPMKEEFEDLFESTFSSKRNRNYLNSIGNAISKGRWQRAITLWLEAVRSIEDTFETSKNTTNNPISERQPKRRRLDSTKYQKLKSRWDKFALDVEFLRQHVVSGSKGVAFSFVESNIVKAARQGDWVLLDEINLASSDTLESLSDLFSTAPNTPNILLSERGDTERVEAHRNFRVFGSMNPATDVGKKDLPIGLRSKFTEIYIDSPDKYFENILSVAKAYLGEKNNHDIWAATGVAHLYLEIKRLVEENRLVDGANQKPHFSFRTLTRTLVYVLDILPIYGLRRALYEGFSMSFLTSLNQESELLLLPLIEKHILGSRNRQAFLYQTPRAPQDDRKYVQFRHYWIAQGDSPTEIQPRYIITPFIERNFLNLVRATSTRRFPVLLQGPTSSGKTSMVEYLARISGNKFVRINNHEHTDLQEYLGSYVSSLNGRLEYQDGILVRALKEGHWIVLDELNLAPTDVLEALNRLLDDNKELWIPETQQTIRPHENFVLFATQNPPGMYGGRKILSRAFRNRFLELHFDDIPEDELETILRERSQIAPSFCTKIVGVYKKLSILRQRDRFFEQRNSFATLRDLFRWALRDADDREQLAVNGFHLLAERVRNVDEREKVKSIIEDVMKLKIDENHMYSFGSSLIPHNLHHAGSGEIVWTKSMRRLCVLVTQALRRNEPVLLVGETGSGKTTICQVVANLMSTKLHILNAHQNMETGDLIGAQRPVRNRASIEEQLIVDISSILMEYSLYKEDFAKTLRELLEAYDALLQRGDHSISNNLRSCIEQNRVRLKALFEWSDSNLVSAMRQGEPFLLDEISLADDSVLERLNSVLETDRKLLLAEKGSADVLITASPGFQFLATMNPGGDYGKRELSPALRNRFTEIWVPQITEHDEIAEIVSAKLLPPLYTYAASMIDFAIWYQKTYKTTISAISIREILAWIEFVNKYYSVDPYFALLHGAAMVYIDCLGANPAAKVSVPESEIPVQRQICLRKLEELFDHPMIHLYNQEYQISLDDHSLSFGPFSIEGSGTSKHNSNYILNAPTIVRNMMKLTRALQLEKPILLEGSPGVGKTTLVIALANATGNTLTRINLSEQTDLMDLFGSDIPVEEDDIGHFSWRDAPFLRAMQTGQWVLLDEMNLASQAVLEGLNACFDHRGEIYIPELDQTFKKHPRFTVFAAQNPHHQGGGRKGLPASFVNRFTVVYADTFTAEDLVVISSRSYPTFSAELTKSLVSCITSISHLLQTNRRIGIRGAPWEINLRDILRWSDLLNSSDLIMSAGSAKDYQKILFLQRFRTFEDIAAVSQLLETYVLQDKRIIGGFHHTSSRYMQVGLALIARDPISQPVYCQDPKPYSINLSVAESVLLCVQKNWPCLLVGPSGCGKSQLVFQLASKIGAEVVSLPLNADMDTIDLIGGYEQVDCHRETVGLITKLRQVVCRHFVESLASFPERSKEFASIDERFATVKPGIQELQEIAGLIQRLEEDDPNLPFSNILEQCQMFLQRLSGNYRGRFEWIDGILVKALKQGQWLILDNANLCASSVLDRLNSLLEPDGFLSIHEYRTLDGAAHMVKPHPNFRIFLTMDPRHGELSRSMRNRCIELFMPSQPLIEIKSCFSSSESFISRFQILESIDWDDSNFVNFHALLSVCLDYLTIADYKWSDQWQNEVVKGLIKLPASRQNLFISALSVRKQILTSNTFLIHSLEQVHKELVKNLGLSNFEDMQVSLNEDMDE